MQKQTAGMTAIPPTCTRHILCPPGTSCLAVNLQGSRRRKASEGKLNWHVCLGVSKGLLKRDLEGWGEGREGHQLRGSWGIPDQKRRTWLWSPADLGTCSGDHRVRNWARSGANRAQVGKTGSGEQLLHWPSAARAQGSDVVP